MIEADGPRSNATSNEPMRCPEVPAATGKFTICAAKINAADKPSRGYFEGASVFRVRFAEIAIAATARPPQAMTVFASRKPSGICIQESVDQQL
jgi:hypothetical protein